MAPRNSENSIGKQKITQRGNPRQSSKPDPIKEGRENACDIFDDTERASTQNIQRTDVVAAYQVLLRSESVGLSVKA